MSLWIVAAVETELSLLKARLDRPETVRNAPYDVVTGELCGLRAYLGVLGVGVVSAALALGRLLTRMPTDRVIMVGSAGSLPGSGLEVGDVAVATTEMLAEMGVCAGPGIGDRSLSHLPGLHHELPLDAAPAEVSGALPEDRFRIVPGRFLTVVGVSGDREQAAARARRFRALAENMEGYALAAAGRSLGISVGEVRGIGNRAGDRDKSTWRLDMAAAHAQETVLRYLSEC